MKKNTFEKFVHEHRDEFDDKSPSENVWKQISHALFGSKSNSPWNSVSILVASAMESPTPNRQKSVPTQLLHVR